MAAHGYSFGSVEVRAAQRQVLVEGHPVAIGGRAFDLLLALIERAHRPVSKDELYDAIWPGRIVEPNNLAVQVNGLRKVLGAGTIATIPGRGYQFVGAAVQGNDETVLQAPAQAPTPGAPAQLPRALTPLIGRADDDAAVRELLRQHRLVNIVGTGGIGKTRLAQQVLHGLGQGYRQGVAWAELSGLSDPQLLAGALAQAAGVSVGAGDPLKSLVAVLKPLNMLLGVDNAEHLIDEAARVVNAVLEGTPGVSVLVTSRATLKLQQEQVFRLQPLQLPEPGATLAEAQSCAAVELFEQRARAADSRFVLGEANIAAAVDVCRGLDGLPLAIELAAARVPLLGVARLMASLHERLRVLNLGLRDAPARQQTLRAALQWSHELLGAREQRVFRRLAVFAGSFALEMVEPVVADEAEDASATLDALAELVDHSLVEVDASDPPRYRLFESTRAFALELLKATGEEQACRARHAQVVLAHFERHYASQMAGVLAHDALDMLAPDLDNARSAFAWSLAHDPGAAVALAAPLMLALLRCGTLEASRVYEATAPHVKQDLPPPRRARWLLGASRFWSNRRPALAAAYAKEALQLYRSLGDPVCQYHALAALLQLPILTSDELQAALAELRALEQPSWPPKVLVSGAWAEAMTKCDDPPAQLRAFERVLGLCERAGDSRVMLRILGNIADLELTMGRVDDAIRHGTEIVLRMRRSRDLFTLPLALCNLACAWLNKGDAEMAREVAQEGWPLARQCDQCVCWPDILGLLAAREGRAESAALCLGYSDADYRNRGTERQTNEARAVQQAEALARARLGDAEFERLRLEGEGLQAQAFDAIAL